MHPVKSSPKLKANGAQERADEAKAAREEAQRAAREEADMARRKLERKSREQATAVALQSQVCARSIVISRELYNLCANCTRSQLCQYCAFESSEMLGQARDFKHVNHCNSYSQDQL